jgi:acyl carrier protein
MSDDHALEGQLKDLIVDVTGRPELETELDVDAPLLGETVGLDSMDVLSLLDAVRDRYDVDLDISKPDVRQAFASVHGIAELLRQSGVSQG